MLTRAPNGATTMCALLVKCAALIVMINVFRALGRLAGPRWSALALGLPSTTAIVLCYCGCEHGSGPAIVMAESSLLGLVAGVALPLAYAWATAYSWRLPSALAVSILTYVGIASALGCLPATGALARLGIAASALVCAAYSATRIPDSFPDQRRRAVSGSISRTMAIRAAFPVLYMVFLVIAEHLAGPSWAGLGSTFPSMSLAVLFVTALEVGPGEASRIARVLPMGNLSTLAFLAAFRFSCPEVGAGGAMFMGYAAAIGALLAITKTASRAQRVLGSAVRTVPAPGRDTVAWRVVTEAGPRGVRARTRSDIHAHPAAQLLLRRRPAHRGCFLPRVETLAW
jgi:hypothetical protein